MVNDLIFQNQVSLYSVTKGLQSSYTNIFNYLLSWKLYLDTLDYMYHSVYLVPSQFLVANYLIWCTNIMSNKRGRGLLILYECLLESAKYSNLALQAWLGVLGFLLVYIYFKLQSVHYTWQSSSPQPHKLGFREVDCQVHHV